MGSKKADEKSHFRNRMLQRFGLTVTKEDMFDLVKMVQTNNYISAEKQSVNRTYFRVIFKEREMIIVYDKIRKCFITCLYVPEEVTVIEQVEIVYEYEEEKTENYY